MKQFCVANCPPRICNCTGDDRRVCRERTACMEFRNTFYIETIISYSSLEAVKIELYNRIYMAAKMFEDLENCGKISGNGHHARQNIAEFAANELEFRWKR